MNRFLLVISIVFSFQLANAGDQCDGVFSDAGQILVEVLNSPTACEAFAKAGIFAADKKKISVRSEPILDRIGDYDGTRYIISIAGEYIRPALEPTGDDPEYRLATLKFVSLLRGGRCIFNTSPLYSESKITKNAYDKL